MMEATSPHQALFWEYWDDIITQVSWLLIAFFIGWICATAYWQVPHLWNRSNQLTHVERVVIPAIKGKQQRGHTESLRTDHSPASTTN